MHKGGFAAEAVPPPDHLVAAIRHARDLGRPVWGLDIQTDQGPLLVPYPTQDATVNTSCLRAELRYALTSGHGVGAGALEKSHSSSQARKLFAAALRDLAGGQLELVAQVCGYGAEREARRATQQGRKLWAQLSTWPWVHFADGTLAHGSWRHDADVIAGWATWSTPDPRLGLAIGGRAYGIVSVEHAGEKGLVGLNVERL